MSTTENQNGTAGGAQSNGIKTLSSSSSSSSTASSTTSSGVSPSSGGRVGLPNNSNSSFLYSSSTMLSREKARQVPPPTLPKYTSSFNAGSNGGGGTADRLTREREAGGSYRLASLDRLALRQRILDGEKANGEPISVSETTLPSLRYGFHIARADITLRRHRFSTWTIISLRSYDSFLSSGRLPACHYAGRMYRLMNNSVFNAILNFI